MNKAVGFIQSTFIEWGGLTSVRVWLLFISFLWASWVFLREFGCLPKKSVKGKHVFITGAGSGIGRDMARRFV